MSVTIIINPVSGGASAARVRARAELAAAVARQCGVLPEVHVTEGPGHACELARAAVAKGDRLVMAWGGDGTVNEVASALAFQPVPLGIVPSGSGNGLARALRVNRHAPRAIADALGARPRAVDLGELGGRIFVNLAGVGVDAQIAWLFGRPGNRRRGLLGYATLTARSLMAYEPDHYAIETDAGRHSLDALLITIANSTEFGHGARIAPGARMDDGWLDLVLVENRPLWRTACSLPRLFTGAVERVSGCSTSRIRRATIRCRKPMRFHVDGEPVEGGTCLEARIHPGALLVAVK